MNATTSSEGFERASMDSRREAWAYRNREDRRSIDFFLLILALNLAAYQAGWAVVLLGVVVAFVMRRCIAGDQPVDARPRGVA